MITSFHKQKIYERMEKQMEKLKEEKILGTVPKNYQCVENFWDCPEFSLWRRWGIR